MDSSHSTHKTDKENANTTTATYSKLLYAANKFRAKKIEKEKVEEKVEKIEENYKTKYFVPYQVTKATGATMKEKPALNSKAVKVLTNTTKVKVIGRYIEGSDSDTDTEKTGNI